MRRVIEKNKGVVCLAEINSSKLYGVVRNNVAGMAQRCWIGAVGSENYADRWAVLNSERLSSPRVHGLKTHALLSTILKDCLSRGEEVYEFDSSEDLLRWLAGCDQGTSQGYSIPGENLS